MITIRKTFSLVEKFLRSSFVEFSAHLITEGHPSHMEVGILSVFNPVSPLSLLKTVGRPVPSVLGFDNVEFTVKPHCHNRMARVRTSSIHDDLVETIEAHNCEIISRLDERRIDVHLFYGSNFHWVLDGIS